MKPKKLDKETKKKKRLDIRMIRAKERKDWTIKEKNYMYKKQSERNDRIFAQYIIQRDKCCIICGSSNNLQCSHFYTKRSHENVRWDTMNAHAMCSSCHCKHHNQDPLSYSKWMIEKYSSELDFLTRKANVSAFYDIDDLIRIEIYFTGMVHNG